jgi:DNA primase
MKRRGMDVDDFLTHRTTKSRGAGGGKLAARVDVPKLLAALDIDFVPPRGGEIWAPCPFHDEREGSFQIKHLPGQAENGLWRCFGCKAHGNAIGLVKGLRGVDWVEARAMLDDLGALAKPPPLPTKITVEIMNPKRKFRIPPGVVFAPLDKWVTPPRRYAIERGITPEQVVRWSIGYAIEGRLRGRIVMPLFDRKGKPYGYTARTFIDAEKRYIEPKREERAVLGAVFGEYHWKPVDERGKRGTCIVTEGGLNGLAVERAIELIDLDADFGAVRGSNLLPGHAARLSTFDRALVASDPDDAGDALFAALHGMLGRWVKMGRVLIPKGKDCNDLDPNDLAQRIFDAQPIHGT